jgi:hypothetical protein
VPEKHRPSPVAGRAIPLGVGRDVDNEVDRAPDPEKGPEKRLEKKPHVLAMLPLEKIFNSF